MTIENRELVLLRFVQLRATVGFLGEKNLYNWWDTNFLSPTGLQFLAINFPRTAISAGVNSVTEAAKRLHDERIGKGGVYHLFRLPTSIEQDIHNHLLREGQDEVRAYLESKDTALTNLERLVSSSVGAPEGPVQIGTLKNLQTDESIKEVAVHYHDAFKNQKKCFPYFKID
jgi:hypothetical protein